MVPDDPIFLKKSCTDQLLLEQIMDHQNIPCSTFESDVHVHEGLTPVQV